MKPHPILYWASTVLLSGMMLMAAEAYLTHNPKIMEAFAHLGYPAYFAQILGVAKILGVLALLAPGLPRLKEWAYSGFVITFISAFISHLVSNEAPKALAPVIALALLVVSYLTRPASRSLPVAPVVQGTWRPTFNNPPIKPTPSHVTHS